MCYFFQKNKDPKTSLVVQETRQTDMFVTMIHGRYMARDILVAAKQIVVLEGTVRGVLRAE